MHVIQNIFLLRNKSRGNFVKKKNIQVYGNYLVFGNILNLKSTVDDCLFWTENELIEGIFNERSDYF